MCAPAKVELNIKAQVAVGLRAGLVLSDSSLMVYSLLVSTVGFFVGVSEKSLHVSYVKAIVTIAIDVILMVTMFAVFYPLQFFCPPAGSLDGCSVVNVISHFGTAIEAATQEIELHEAWTFYYPIAANIGGLLLGWFIGWLAARAEEWR